MMRRIPFASCYVYSPGGSSDACKRSRLLRTLLKTGDAYFLGKYAARVRQQLAEHAPLAGFVTPAHVWVPVPGSAPDRAGRCWVAEHLALALIDEGVGQGIWTGINRQRAVRKSATASRGHRPSVGYHYDSFAIDATVPPPARVVLIDDVITKGRTLLAAASRLHDSYPRADIRAFALLRTMGMVDGVEALLDPCVGEIRWRAGDARRFP